MAAGMPGLIYIYIYIWQLTCLLTTKGGNVMHLRRDLARRKQARLNFETRGTNLMNRT